MVWCHHPLLVFRQMFKSLDAQPKDHAHQHAIHRIEKTRSRSGDQAERLEPLFLLLVEDFVGFFQRIDRFAFAALCHFVQEIAHGLDARDRFIGQFHSAGFGDFQREI